MVDKGKQSSSDIPPAASMPVLHVSEEATTPLPEPASAPVLPAPSLSAITDEGGGSEKEICAEANVKDEEQKVKQTKENRIIKLLRQLCLPTKMKKNKSDVHQDVKDNSA